MDELGIIGPTHPLKKLIEIMSIKEARKLKCIKEEKLKNISNQNLCYKWNGFL